MKQDLIEDEEGVIKLVEKLEDYTISRACNPNKSAWKDVFNFVVHADYRVQRFVYN